MDFSDLARRNLLDVFGERDPQARAAAIEEIYTEQVTFTDPDEVVVGRAALGAKAQKLLDDSPGLVFTPAGPARIAGDLVMLGWHLGPAGQPPVVSGVDIALVADGRITAIYTLLD